jgi:hypothetical protein
MSNTPRTNALDIHIQSDAFMDGPQRPSGYELMRDLATTFECQNTEALALLRELNDALAIPGWLQPRVDAILDSEKKPEQTAEERAADADAGNALGGGGTGGPA